MSKPEEKEFRRALSRIAEIAKDVAFEEFLNRRKDDDRTKVLQAKSWLIEAIEEEVQLINAMYKEKRPYTRRKGNNE